MGTKPELKTPLHDHVSLCLLDVEVSSCLLTVGISCWTDCLLKNKKGFPKFLFFLNGEIIKQNSPIVSPCKNIGGSKVRAGPPLIAELEVQPLINVGHVRVFEQNSEP